MYLYSASSSPHTQPLGLTSLLKDGRTVSLPLSRRLGFVAVDDEDPCTPHPGELRRLALERRSAAIPTPLPLSMEPCREVDRSARNLDKCFRPCCDSCCSSPLPLLPLLPLLLPLLPPASAPTLPTPWLRLLLLLLLFLSCFDDEGLRFFGCSSAGPPLRLCQLSPLNHPPPPPPKVGRGLDGVKAPLPGSLMIAPDEGGTEGRRLPSTTPLPLPLPALPTEPEVAGSGRATGWMRCSPRGVVGSSLSLDFCIMQGEGKMVEERGRREERDAGEGVKTSEHAVRGRGYALGDG